MDLGELARELNILHPLADGLPDVTGISMDSRTVAPGNLYIAIPGTHADGHDYIAEAVKAGASAVLGSRPASELPGLDIPYLQVEDPRQALAELGAAWYGYPGRQLVVIGVTGTDGKTTTVNLIHSILTAAGIRAGLISTVNAVIGDRVLDTGFHVTTPEALDIQYYLSEMVQAGISHVVLEATSHGLAQKRVAACEFDIGVVTNITHEHLDYHGDYSHYLGAKAELFKLVSASPSKPLPVRKVAVLNRDDQSYPLLKPLIESAGLPLIDYGLDPGADYRALGISANPAGVQFEVQGRKGTMPLQTHLLGAYNVLNCLAAVGVGLEGLDLDKKAVQQGISDLASIPGRMERIDLGQDFITVVDFAHTPNALRKALTAGREMTAGKVIAVFGSAGLRDREKRRMMAAVSAELADITILTAEDPRVESLSDILAEMAAGAEAKGGIEGRDYYRVADRGEAIRRALDLAGPGDVVMICGKGHEQSMCFGDREVPWDDRTAARAALAERLGVEGPAMPYLPTQG